MEGLVEEVPMSLSQLVSWNRQSLEDVSTTDHSNDNDGYKALPKDCSIQPTAPQAAQEPNTDNSCLPILSPCTAFLEHLPYEVTEKSIKEYFRGLNIRAVCLPSEPSNPERLTSFGYAEFEDLDSLFNAPSVNKESLNYRIWVDIADEVQDKEKDDGSFGWVRNWDSDKTNLQLPT